MRVRVRVRVRDANTRGFIRGDARRKRGLLVPAFVVGLAPKGVQEIGAWVRVQK